MILLYSPTREDSGTRSESQWHSDSGPGSEHHASVMRPTPGPGPLPGPPCVLTEHENSGFLFFIFFKKYLSSTNAIAAVTAPGFECCPRRWLKTNLLSVSPALQLAFLRRKSCLLVPHDAGCPSCRAVLGRRVAGAKCARHRSCGASQPQ